ncbi:MAG: Heat shock protein 15, partial [Acidobacteriota bacterium]|nr:Heat shock protein 15 [Acidobacteriota bacterium]
MSTRLDKWLTIARVYKTRTLSAHACDLSRVRVNGVAVKPHR